MGANRFGNNSASTVFNFICGCFFLRVVSVSVILISGNSLIFIASPGFQ